MSKLIKNEGLVIKIQDYQEAMVIATILTKDKLQNYLIRGAKKITTSTHPLANPLTYITFTQTDKDNLPTITEGKVVNNYTSIKNDLNKINASSIILEKIKFFGDSITDYETFFNFTMSVITLLDKTNDLISVISIFEIKLLYLLGVAPNLKSCVNCEKKEHLKFFSVHLGGMLCEECSIQKDSYSTELVLLFKEIYYKKIADLTFEVLDKYNNHELWTLIDDYYSYHLEFKSFTKKVFNQIFFN